MKSNLALLDQVVTETVAHELGKSNHDEATLAKLGVAPQRFREVAGLRIVSNAARDAEVDSVSAKRLDRLLRFRNDAELVREKLARAGVKPLVVLPDVAWERICEKAGLYRFKPKDGKVFINVGGVDAIFNTAWEQVRAETRAKLNPRDRLIDKIMSNTVAMVTLLSFVMAIVGFCALKDPLYTMGPFWPWIIIVASSCIFLLGGANLSRFGPEEMPPNEKLKPVVVDRIRKLIAEYDDAGTLIQHLWPERCEWARDSLQVKVAFPEPPKDVQERIALAERARLPINLAVTPDAISFLEDPTAVILKEEQRRWDEQVARLKADPIAYVVEWSAVAIIDQYGDFPIEKEVINEVINSEYLV